MKVLRSHDGPHDFFLAGLGTREFADETAFVHHIDAVAHAEQFRHFGRDHQHAFTFVGQRVDDRVDLVFGPDIDAARRFVENEDLRLREQPFAEHDFLLVAAAEVHGLLFDPVGPDVQLASIVRGDRVLAVTVDHHGGGDAGQVGERRVLGDVLVEHEAELFAVLGHIGDAAVDRSRDGRHVGWLAIDQHLAGNVLTVGSAEDAHRELRPARPHQPRHADDLATVDAKIDVLDDGAVRMDVVMGCPVADLEQGTADLGVRGG